jgi:hypothetical protein
METWSGLRRMARRPVSTITGGPLNAMMYGMQGMMESMDAVMAPPMDAMVAGWNAMTRGFSRGTDGGDDGGNGGGQSSRGGYGAEGTETTAQGGTQGGGQDLSSDDVKVVDWWVFYMKPGEEQVLGQGTETVTYPTSGSSLGARLISRVLDESSEHFSERDRDQHIEFRYSVKLRMHRRAHEYDRRVAEGVERIADELRRRKVEDRAAERRPDAA